METKKNNISKNGIDRYVNDLMIFWSSLDVNDVLIFYVNDVLIFIRYSLEVEEYFIDENRDGVSDYSFDVPDFTVDEWFSNLVIRWEFLPGSTAYLVWSQTRDYFDSSGAFEVMDNVDKLFTDKRANNTFLLKVSYRFGLR
ncbi:MAG: DUF5916 domain-containing protein [Bacteroidales bacterium]|nr:DUF5916 domain-containing protein [Bacteroidales bacterium]